MTLVPRARTISVVIRRSGIRDSFFSLEERCRAIAFSRSASRRGARLSSQSLRESKASFLISKVPSGRPATGRMPTTPLGLPSCPVLTR